MKRILPVFLLLISKLLFAQDNRPLETIKPGEASTLSAANPSIPITPSTSTSIIPQPQGMPGSNTNPTTGTVIGIKKKKTVAQQATSTVNKRSDSSSKPRKPLSPNRFNKKKGS